MRSRTIVFCCTQWYSHDVERSRSLLRILQRKCGYSLRVIDWMVTNYSKHHSLTVQGNGSNNPTNIHSDYERHLAVYNKRYYDPFARREKIHVTILCTPVVTTVGQLNFFKWFIERNLDDVVKIHLTDIESDMKRGKKPVSTTPPSTTIHHGRFHLGFV